MRFAGIGHRDTPPAICEEMTYIGRWALEHGHQITSGHAPGADWAFERGAQRNCIVYLPWEGFNAESPLLGTWTVPTITPELEDLVRKYHPNPGRLSPGAFNLMARNGCQVLGARSDKPVHPVVCYRVRSSGTDQALRIAEDRRIPILNMALDKYGDAGKVICELERLAGCQ